MKLGVALRPTVFTPKEIVKIVAALDNRAKVLTTVFIPDVAAGAEPIELSIASLAASKRLHVGSGVIRITEHDTEQLARRILTAQSVSDGRFILGVGTGAVGKDPATKINAMFGKLSELKDKILQRKSATIPKVYIATLRRGIARISAGRCDGILMNFCSAEHAGRVISSFRSEHKGDAEFACYIKIFYSHDVEIAQRNMIQEFANYDSLPQYQKMFIEDCVHEDILHAKEELAAGRVYVTESLARISLFNPSPSSLADLIDHFTKSGITLPVIYPYFDESDDQEYKQKILLFTLKQLDKPKIF
ncbi:MAG: LLM class flavin-dependent oxidoreductase [Conexivisphaerales archaeon]